MAASAFFIACKATEQIIKIKELSLTFLNIQKLKFPNKLVNEENIEKISKQILFYEFHLLAILDYNFIAPLPYGEIFSIVSKNYSGILLRIANNFANDSFRTRVGLRFNAEEIAEACVYLAAEFLDIDQESRANMEAVAEIMSIYPQVI